MVFETVPDSALSFYPNFPQRSTIIRMCKPSKLFPFQVAFGNDLYHNNRNQTKTQYLFRSAFIWENTPAVGGAIPWATLECIKRRKWPEHKHLLLSAQESNQLCSKNQNPKIILQIFQFDRTVLEAPGCLWPVPTVVSRYQLSAHGDCSGAPRVGFGFCTATFALLNT